MTDAPKYGFEIHEKEGRDKRLVWHMAGPSGGIHIWAQAAEFKYLDERFIGGVEVHYKKKPHEHSPDEPPIKNCWLTGCDCWPDGSSLYFSENIAPMVEAYEDNPESLCDYMNGEMLSWYRSHLSRDDFPETPVELVL